MGEREQKRLYHAPLADSIVGQPYPWVHYLLGGSKDQLAVWHGQQMTSPFCDTVRRRNVFLYPTEYLTYGVGHQSSLLTRPDGSKEYRLFDHLGSSRAVIGTSGATYSDYAPFGGLLGGGTESRKGFIDKEKDGESGLRNFGVRQYDEEAGRFVSVDALWEEYRGWSPYGYALDNPLVLVDASGLSAEHPNSREVAEVSGEEIEEVNGRAPPARPSRSTPNRSRQSHQRSKSSRSGRGNEGTSPSQQARLQRKAEETQTRNNPWEQMERNSANKDNQELNFSNSALRHANDVVKRGENKGSLVRPYMRTPQLLANEIMQAGLPRPDPQGSFGVVRWDVNGTFNNSTGNWELVLHVPTNTVVHFLFVSTK